MELLRLPKTIYEIGVHTYNGTQHIRHHVNEKKAFHQSLPNFLDGQVATGNLTRNGAAAAAAGAAAAPEWTMTTQGLQAIFDIYTDVYPTLQSLPDGSALWQELASTTVTVTSGKQGSQKSLRNKIGSRWRPQMRDLVLRDKTANPNLSMSRVKRLGRYRMAMGLLRKAARSDGFGHLIIPRVLGLAQLCGIESVDFGELHELLTHSHYYELLYRAYLARFLADLDATAVANTGYGPVFNHRLLGTTPLDEASAMVSTTSNQLVQIGAISQSKVAVGPQFTPTGTIAPPLEFRIPKAAEVREGEPVYMHSGWANCFILRSGLQQQSHNYPVQHDVHGSPLYGPGSLSPFSFKLKRMLDGRLVAISPMIGLAKLPRPAGQGLFGRPCGCGSPVRGRTIHAGNRAVINDVEVTETSTLAMDRLMYHNLYLIWCAQDIAMQVWLANAYMHSTYIQVSGECLYCAINRAIGTGCSFLVAGAGMVA